MGSILLRWTESELLTDIDRIGVQIETRAQRDDERSKCARSYLQQLLRDRRDALAVLRTRRTIAVP